MMKNFDLFVIGTGVAATTVVGECLAAGWSVGIADERPYGGTCPLRGCDPKKVLVGASAVEDDAMRYTDRGILKALPTIDWGELQKFKRTFTEPISNQIESWLESEGVSLYHGHVQFTGENTLSVGGNEIEAKHILIATGASPTQLHIPGEEQLTTSDEFLDWEDMPARVVFVGGGYIAFEFAHMALRAGVKVTVLQRGSRALKGFDGPLVQQLTDYSSERGIDLHVNTTVTGIRKDGDHLVVEAEENGHKVEFAAEAAVHAAGREPNLESLCLDEAKVRFGQGGVEVNEHLQSVSNPRVYAAGDSANTPGLPLTPVATMEGQVTAHNLLHDDKRVADNRGVPTIVYTTPALAGVGLTEDEAKQQGIKVKVNRDDTSAWYSARQSLAPIAGFSVLIDEGTDKVVGAHILGPHAEELINLFSLAIRQGIPASELREHPFAYPTGASDMSSMV